MEMKTVRYQVMSNGVWVSATVSKFVANQLAIEYKSYGWPVEVLSVESEATNRKVA